MRPALRLATPREAASAAVSVSVLVTVSVSVPVRAQVAVAVAVQVPVSVPVPVSVRVLVAHRQGCRWWWSPWYQYQGTSRAGVASAHPLFMRCCHPRGAPLVSVDILVSVVLGLNHLDLHLEEPAI